jgi:hypothetical protein
MKGLLDINFPTRTLFKCLISFLNLLSQTSIVILKFCWINRVSFNLEYLFMSLWNSYETEKHLTYILYILKQFGKLQLTIFKYFLCCWIEEF